jgi:hypothetical protein
VYVFCPHIVDVYLLKTENGIMLNHRNEKMRDIAHSKCNKDIRIGVTAACKEFGMKITGRGSIAGCESSNLIDIPIICDVLQSIGLFEDSSFPNPSDKVDKAERAERKAAKKAALLALSDSSAGGEDTGKGVAIEANAAKSVPASDGKNSTCTVGVPATTVEGEVSSNPDARNSSDCIEEKNDQQIYAPNLIDIENILTRRWNHQLQDYITDMQRRKTPYHYHAADGISSEGVAMVASYLPTPAPTPKHSPRSTPKIMKIAPKVRKDADDKPLVSSSSDDIQLEGSSENGVSGSGNGGGVMDGEVTACLDRDSESDSATRKRPLPVSVVTDSDNITEAATVDVDSGECPDPDPDLDSVILDQQGGESAAEKANRKRQRKIGSSASTVVAIQSLPERNTTPYASKSAKKNKAIRATKGMMQNVIPFELSATPRMTPGSASSTATRRQFRESNVAGEQLNLLDNGDVDSAGMSGDQRGSEQDDDCVNNSRSRKSDNKEKTKKAPREKKEKRERKVKLKDINTDHGTGDDDVSAAKLSSTSSKKAKRKELLVVISPATGGVVATVPSLPPRIGSGGVGGTTTGYTIAPSLLKPSLSNIGHGGSCLRASGNGNGSGGDSGGASGREALSSAQEMFSDPAGALQAWSAACYEEGLVLAEEEVLLRRLAGLCELSLPAPAFRIGTRYLDPEYSYMSEAERLKGLTNVLEEVEEQELVLREELMQSQGFVDSRVEEALPFGIAAGAGVGSGAGSGGGGGGGGGRRRRMSVGGRPGRGRRDRERAMPALGEMDAPPPSPHGGGGRGGVGGMAMMHSAVSLDSHEASYFDQFEGEEYEKVTDANVSLTASMLWQRAQANAVHKPAALSSVDSHLEIKQRPKREKKDFFDEYICDAGGQTIASMATTTLASVAGMKKLHQNEDELSSVVQDQIEKLKKGGRHSAASVTTLHPGAMQALEVHGVSSTSALPLPPPPGGSGGFKRQRSLSNVSSAVVDIRSSYFADTIGGYPTKNTTPQLILHPPLYAAQKPPSPVASASKKSQVEATPPSVDVDVDVDDGDDSSSLKKIVIHTCSFSHRLSLQDLTVYSVKMPWQLLAREFEVFDPSAMDKDAQAPAYPRTPTSSLPGPAPTSPRFPSQPASSSSSSSSSGGAADTSTSTTSNLNGPMGIWVPSTAPVTQHAPLTTGLRITAPQLSATSSTSQIRRRRKRNSDGVLMEIDSRAKDCSPRPAGGAHQAGEQGSGHREFRRIAFSDVLAPSFRPVVEVEEEGGSESDEEEDISDEAILKRHEATLTSMRDRYTAIQELKNSLKKSASGEDASGTGSGAASTAAHPTSNIIHAHNKRRKAGARPPTPKHGVKKPNIPPVPPSTAATTSAPSSASPKTPKYTIVDKNPLEKLITTKVATRRSRSPTTHGRIPGGGELPLGDDGGPLPRKRGRPTKLDA